MTQATPATDAHEAHMANLKGISNSKGRAEYIAAVERAEGRFYAKWLCEDFAKWWETRGVKP
jgi:hypothetical protein